ncbi:MAG: hypothetical protein LBQ60_03280 [Bacteroidales bacterium]|jgi:hypothetical protein|nr:hypothetical protein [Bacteroidales bacterium]
MLHKIEIEQQLVNKIQCIEILRKNYSGLLFSDIGVNYVSLYLWYDNHWECFIEGQP